MSRGFAMPAAVRPSAEVVSQRIGEETVLLNLKTGVYWGLNATGAAIWEQILAHGNVSGIVAALGEEFDASEEQLTSAVEEMLARLSREGLVVPFDCTLRCQESGGSGFRVPVDSTGVRNRELHRSPQTGQDKAR